jgi:uncharacterized protein (TIGR02147 family)
VGDDLQFIKMAAQIYEFTRYKDYLRGRVAEARGNLKVFSEAAGCQPSYLSRVCSSKIQLTQDHAFRLCRHWGFDSDERQYFMDLVDMERAADPGLRDAINSRIRAAQAKHANLQARTSRTTADQVQTSSIYHSQWTYAAIHFLTSTLAYTTVHEISQRLWLPEAVVSDVLSALMEWGFVRKQGQKYLFATGASHIPKNSPALPMFHSNWRTKAVQDSQNPTNDGLHFTNIQTVSRSDLERLKQIAAQFVQTTAEIAGPSQPEELVVITCDVFKP